MSPIEADFFSPPMCGLTSKPNISFWQIHERERLCWGERVAWNMVCSVFAHYNHFGTQNSIQFVSALKHLSKISRMESACKMCVHQSGEEKKSLQPNSKYDMISMNDWFLFVGGGLFVIWQKSLNVLRRFPKIQHRNGWLSNTLSNTNHSLRIHTHTN